VPVKTAEQQATALLHRGRRAGDSPVLADSSVP
jgi:hypothetical protein